MRVRKLNLFVGSGLLLAASASGAQAPADPGATTTSGFELEEIVITARRRTESLQDVPQTVDAVTADDIEKLSLQKFEDVQAIVPGLTLSSGATGYTTAATVRGASFQVESSASPTVEFYLNDAPIQSVFLFQTMYDVGQIEVLRGPQGTLRGRAAPSGSITVTTHQADVAEFGGYASALGTSEGSYQAQGAVNIPLIQDSLALRVAGLYDESEYNQVKSLYNSKDPSQETKSGRVSLRWEAGDTVGVSLVYQHLQRELFSFDAYQSYGLAEPTEPVIAPVLKASDRRSVLDGGRASDQEQDLVTAQIDWRFAGQKLSYVGSYNKMDLVAPTPLDLGAVVPNTEFFQQVHTKTDAKAHELRLSSEERMLGFLDYTVGGFYQDFSSPTDLVNQTLIGQQTGTYTLAAIGVPQNIERRSTTEEMSFFGNLTFHVGDNTEFSAGARYIDFQADALLNVVGLLTLPTESEETATVWNIAGSHRFNDDFMVYANVGTSWRDGPQAVGIFRPTTPNLTAFTNLDSEDSTSYEMGFKADFLDRRLRLNASVFYQDFENFIYRGPPVWYVDLTRTGAAPAQFPLLANVDAEVAGAEVDVALQATENFNVGVTFAYAKGEMKDGVIPCNDFNRDGQPDQGKPVVPTLPQLIGATGGNPLAEAVSSCTVDDRLSFAPDWSATLQAEYKWPVSASLDVFGRALYSYYTDNEQDPNSIYDDVDAYGLLNLYAGLRSNSGAWEVSVFARNALDTEEVLSRSNGAIATSYRTATGAGGALAGPYMNASFTPAQEFGLNIRYAFGSR